MGTIMQKLIAALNTKEKIRSAIISKGQSVSPEDAFSTYPSKIEAIKSGLNTNDATATPSDILSGKTAYARGLKLTGGISSKTASDLSASGATVSVPAGYYPSAVSKSVTTVEQADISVNVNSKGQIVAQARQTEGYVASGTKWGNKDLTINEQI